MMTLTKALGSNSYPGRGILLGTSEDGRHAGDHGGQIFDGRFRAIAVEIA